MATRNNPDNSFQVFLMAPELTRKLDVHCRATGEAPDDVVHDAVALYLDEHGDLFDLEARLRGPLPPVSLP